MTEFAIMVLAVVVGFLIIGGLLAVLPKKKPTLFCAFCGEEATSLNDVVEHVKGCKSHPLRRELDDAVDYSKRLIDQRERLWYSLHKATRWIEEHAVTTDPGHVCGPESQCDMACMEAARDAELICELRESLSKVGVE